MSSPHGSTDPADQTEQVPGESSVDTSAFTERGEDAETAAFTGDGAYSEGEFAGGDVADPS